MTDLVAARIEQMAQSVFPLVPSSEHALQALQAAMNNERRQQVQLPLPLHPASCSTALLGVRHTAAVVADAAAAVYVSSADAASA